MILFPVSINGESKLANGIDIKTTADGVSGELYQFNIDHGISPHSNYLGSLVAMDKEDAADQFDRDGKKYNQQWGLGLVDAKKWIRGIVQSLKVDNKPVYTLLGDWGINITANGKIMYDETNLGWQTLGEAIVAKNGTYGIGLSPIFQYMNTQQFTITMLSDALTATDGFKTEAGVAYNAAKTARQLSKTLIDVIRADDHLMAEKLVVLHPIDTQHVTEYGYDTNMANASEWDQVSIILPGETLIVHNAKEGTDIEKLEGGDVTITPGLKDTAVPKLFPTNNLLNVYKGMHTFRIKNNALSCEAKVKTTVMKKKTVRGK